MIKLGTATIFMIAYLIPQNT